MLELLGLLLVFLTITPERRGVLLLLRGRGVAILLLESLLLRYILLLLLGIPTPSTTTRIDIATIILLSKPASILRLRLLRLLPRRCICPLLLQPLS